MALYTGNPNSDPEAQIIPLVENIEVWRRRLTPAQSRIYFLDSSIPKARHIVSLTNPLRSFKRTYLSLSRFMAVSKGILF